MHFWTVDVGKIIDRERHLIAFVLADAAGNATSGRETGAIPNAGPALPRAPQAHRQLFERAAKSGNSCA
jgi:hypothetical protein